MLSSIKSALRSPGLGMVRRQISSTSTIRQKTLTQDQVEQVEELRPSTAQMSNMMDIGSRAIFTSEHDMFREQVRKFMKERVEPHQKAFEKAGHPSREIWLEMGAQGMLGVAIPAEVGGIGASFLEEMIIDEEMFYAHSTAPARALHSVICMPYLVDYGTKAQQEQYIPRMTSGECIASIGMTEPDAGSDLQGIRTTAKRSGDDWIINGSKIYITNGWLTDTCIVVAKTKPDAKKAAHGVSLFLVDADTPGFHKGQNLNKLGLKAQDTAELFFEDVRVPSSALLGTENAGFYQLMNQLPQERLNIGYGAIAHCEVMFEDTREWVKQRKVFGQRVADLQTVQHKLAELKTAITVCRAFVDQCTALHMVGKLDSQMASMSKYWATDLENEVAAKCLQLHGGWGFMGETNIAKSYASARVTTIFGGTNEIMKELISRSIVKE